VLLDEVGFNGETWFLAQCFEELRRRGLRGVVSFSDPIPRTNEHGDIVFPGHLGTIYQAHNARFLGRGTARVKRLLPDGRVVDERALSKVRAGERGWLAAPHLLAEFGASVPPVEAEREERLAWLAQWVPQLTLPLRHPGNYRYAWGLDRRVQLAPSLAYPKALAA
jgi:hypothetical protein